MTTKLREIHGVWCMAKNADGPEVLVFDGDGAATFLCLHLKAATVGSRVSAILSPSEARMIARELVAAADRAENRTP